MDISECKTIEALKTTNDKAKENVGSQSLVQSDNTTLETSQSKTKVAEDKVIDASSCETPETYCGEFFSVKTLESSNTDCQEILNTESEDLNSSKCFEITDKEIVKSSVDSMLHTPISTASLISEMESEYHTDCLENGDIKSEDLSSGKCLEVTDKEFVNSCINSALDIPIDTTNLPTEIDTEYHTYCKEINNAESEDLDSSKYSEVMGKEVLKPSFDNALDIPIDTTSLTSEIDIENHADCKEVLNMKSDDLNSSKCSEVMDKEVVKPSIDNAFDILMDTTSMASEIDTENQTDCKEIFTTSSDDLNSSICSEVMDKEVVKPSIDSAFDNPRDTTSMTSETHAEFHTGCKEILNTESEDSSKCSEVMDEKVVKPSFDSTLDIQIQTTSLVSEIDSNIHTDYKKSLYSESEGLNSSKCSEVMDEKFVKPSTDSALDILMDTTSMASEIDTADLADYKKTLNTDSKDLKSSKCSEVMDKEVIIKPSVVSVLGIPIETTSLVSEIDTEYHADCKDNFNMESEDSNSSKYSEVMDKEVVKPSIVSVLGIPIETSSLTSEIETEHQKKSVNPWPSVPTPCPVSNCIVNTKFKTFKTFMQHWRKLHVSTLLQYQCESCEKVLNNEKNCSAHRKLRIHKQETVTFKLVTVHNKDYIDPKDVLPYRSEDATESTEKGLHTAT